MSVAFTEEAVRSRQKTVTRRKGWWTDKNGRHMVTAGDRLTLCRKVMGRKKGEPLVRICDVEVVSVRREPLCAVAGPYVLDESGVVIEWPELVAEGFPGMHPNEFMERYFIDAQGIGVMDDVTRIEWRYLPDPCPECVQGKHGNCDGRTWDDDPRIDGPADCPCYVAGHEAAV